MYEFKYLVSANKSYDRKQISAVHVLRVSNSDDWELGKIKNISETSPPNADRHTMFPSNPSKMWNLSAPKT